jgi:hypothetical protein
MDFPTLCEELRTHELMTDAHFKSLTEPNNNSENPDRCKCGYCEHKIYGKSKTFETVEDLTYESNCDMDDCTTKFYNSRVSIMPYPHCDISIASWPLNRSHTYRFCARCKQKAIIKCGDCAMANKYKQLCDECVAHLNVCGYREGKKCNECSLYRNMKEF